MHGLSTSMLLLLHSTFMLSVVNMLLKGEVGGCALNSHGNYIVDHGKSCKIMDFFLNFCGNPVCYKGTALYSLPTDFYFCSIFVGMPWLFRMGR